MKLVKFPNEFLFKVVKEVINFDSELKKESEEMFALMYEKKGVGLSANQVALDKRIFVMNCSGKPDGEKIFINPEIIEGYDRCVDKEGCLSFPGLYVDITRYKSVKLKWKDLTGKECEGIFNGLEAICVQHELDHLNGIVFVNRLSALKKTMALKKLSKLTDKK